MNKYLSDIKCMFVGIQGIHQGKLLASFTKSIHILYSIHQNNMDGFKHYECYSGMMLFNFYYRMVLYTDMEGLMIWFSWLWCHSGMLQCTYYKDNPPGATCRFHPRDMFFLHSLRLRNGLGINLACVWWSFRHCMSQLHSPKVCEDIIRWDALTLFRTSVLYCIVLYCTVFLACHGVCNAIKCHAMTEAVFTPLANMSSSPNDRKFMFSSIHRHFLFQWT